MAATAGRWQKLGKGQGGTAKTEKRRDGPGGGFEIAEMTDGHQNSGTRLVERALPRLIKSSVISNMNNSLGCPSLMEDGHNVDRARNHLGPLDQETKAPTGTSGVPVGNRANDRTCNTYKQLLTDALCQLTPPLLRNTMSSGIACFADAYSMGTIMLLSRLADPIKFSGGPVALYTFVGVADA